MKVLITGGSRGIGFGIAKRFANEGASVAITYRSNESRAADAREELLKAGARDVKVFALDVTQSAEVDEVVDQVIFDLDGLHVLVNNAGIMENQAAAMMSDEAWHNVIATNLTGPFFVARAALTHFMMERFGRIINISSIAQDGASGQANYAASKAGLLGLTRSLAKEYGPRGITANLVIPGLIETELIEEVDQRIKDHWETFCPVQRLGTVDDVAAAVYFLSQREAGFINGALLHTTGGLDVAP